MNFGTRGRAKRNSTKFIAGMEKWRLNRLVSHRASIFEEISDEEMRPVDVSDWEQELFGKRASTTSEQDVTVQLTRKQTVILSTLLPDEILLMKSFDSGEPTRFVGVLLMADVSGYTALSEKYSSSGKGGSYRLTVTLNTYLGSLIEIIYNHGGDVIKFAGDAFLALWKTPKSTFLGHTIHEVISCALIIQHLFASYETDVKVNLKVKLAISAGNIMFATIGTGIDMNYIITGLPVLEAKKAESMCGSGEVKLTPTAWAHCYTRNYAYIIDDEEHVTVRAILYDPREKDVSKPFLGFTGLSRSKKAFTAVENFPESYWDTPENLSPVDLIKRNESLTLRKSIIDAESRNIGSLIRNFMIRPVLTQVDAHQPLEYLTEMRQVSVVFVTLKPRECTFLQLMTIVNNAYQITCEIVYKSMGCVNKIILFDKDIMMLVIFGLRGFKHESEAQEALKCAYSIKKSVTALDGVLELSIGVTTGSVYCGVVGHPLRREFTVIGSIVNKAARLMCYFRNKITCDEKTFVKSKMSTNSFTLQPEPELKGIRKAGKIFEYTEEIRVKELYNIPMIPPLLNRTDEMEYFERWLGDHKKRFRDFDALLLIGENRIGKTSMIQWMIRFTKNRHFRVCNVNLTSIHSATPYLALNQIVDQLIGIQEPITGFMREEKIVQLLHAYEEDLCYLNTILNVRFAYYEGTQGVNEVIKIEKAKAMFNKLIKRITDTHIIFLDDLQNLDSYSWDFIALMLNSQKIFSIFSLTRGKFSNIYSWLQSVFMNSNIRRIALGPLAPSWIAPLACQILDVDAVSNELCNALKTKCKGMPGLVESFIVHLFSTGALELHKIPDTELDEWKDADLQFPDQSLLHPQTLDSEKQQELDEKLLNDSTGEISICTVIRPEELNTNINVQNIDALIMIQIDSLTPYQQLLLKIASVAGDVVSRDLLENIMYENEHITTAKAIKRLFSMRILTCAFVRQRQSIHHNFITGSSVDRNAPLNCECFFQYDAEEYENLPKYAFCRTMRFKNKNLRNTCYELLPINQKKEFHSRIVNYLENNKQKCAACGGTMMVLQCEADYHRTPELTSNSDDDLTKNVSRASSSNDDDSDNSEYSIQKNETHVLRSQSLPLNLYRNSNIKQVRSTVINGRDSQFGPATINKKNISKGSIEIKSKPSMRVTMQSILRKRMTMLSTISGVNNDDKRIFVNLRNVIKARAKNDWDALGVYEFDNEEEACGGKLEKNQIFYNVTLEPGVSQTDLRKCMCTNLNVIIYEQLINHAKQAELHNKYVEFLIIYSHLNIIATNPDEALLKLREAEQFCINLETQTFLTKFEIRRFLGKIYTLKASAYILLKDIISAKSSLDRATKIYNIKLYSVSELFKTVTSLKKRRSPEKEAVITSDTILFLNTATVFFNITDDLATAKFSCQRALKLIQKNKCEFIDLFDALSNAIQMDLDRSGSDRNFSVEIGRIANDALQNLPRPVKIEEMYALGKLFLVTFRAQIARARIRCAIRLGYKAIVTSVFLQADSISMEIVPELFYILLSQRRFQEAIDLTKEVFWLSRYRTGLECETWYYALCIDLILDAGFQLESPQDISRFAEYALNSEQLCGSGQRRLILGLWTYWLRLNMDRRAKRFEAESLNWLDHQDDDVSLSTLVSDMRLAEGMLESLAHKIDDLRKVVDLMELRSLADRALSKIETDARSCRTIYPRWLLLKATSCIMSGRKAQASNLHSQALEEARKTKNHLELAQLRAVTCDCKHWSQRGMDGHFLDWQEGAEIARTSWHTLLYNISNQQAV